MSEDEQRLFERVLPLDDVESGAIDLAGPVRRADRPRCRRPSTRSRAAADRRLARRRSPTAADALTDHAPRDAWQRAELQRILDDVVGEAARQRDRAGAARAADAARRPPEGPPDARELPHRPPDDLHARADAVGARTASSACSASTTACSRARRRATATTCCSNDPHIGERDAAHRGPPAAARRADGRDRPADRHLHRQRRAHEPRPAARGAGRRAARPRRPRRRRPPPAAAVRPAQLRAGRARAGRALELRHGDAARCASARRRARAAPPVPAGGAAAARRASWSSSTTSCASSSDRCGRSCASGSGSASPTTPTTSRTRCRSSSTGSSEWSVGQRLLDARLAGAERRGGDPRRDRAAARCRPASSACR